MRARRASMRACDCAFWRACVRMCEHACVRASMRGCVPVCVHACVRACERVSIRACVRRHPRRGLGSRRRASVQCQPPPPGAVRRGCRVGPSAQGALLQMAHCLRLLQLLLLTVPLQKMKILSCPHFCAERLHSFAVYLSLATLLKIKLQKLFRKHTIIAVCRLYLV